MASFDQIPALWSTLIKGSTVYRQQLVNGGHAPWPLRTQPGAGPRSSRKVLV
jgi:hypothetical protein